MMGRPVSYDEKNIVLPAYQKLPHFNARYEPKAKYFQIYNWLQTPLFIKWSFGRAEPVSGLCWLYS